MRTRFEGSRTVTTQSGAPGDPARTSRQATRAPSDLSVHPYNLEIYGEPDGGLRDSLAQFGLQHPVVVDPGGQILSGARRWKAASLLGWSQMDVRVLDGATDAETRKFILLANAYRSGKPEHVRKLEADAYLQLLKAGEVTKDDLKALAADRGAVTGGYNGEAPTALAAAVAGMSRMTYSRLRFVLDGGADRAIDRAAKAGEIGGSQADSLRDLVADQRSKLQKGKAGAHTADRRVRSALSEAQRSHSLSAEERQRDQAGQAFDRAMGKGKSFLTAVRDLDGEVAHLGQDQAKALAGVLGELAMLTTELGQQAKGPASNGKGALMPLPPARVPAYLYERLRRLAKLRRCSISTLLEQILEDNVGLQEMASRTPPVASPLVGYDPGGAMGKDARPARRVRGIGVGR